MMMPLMIIKKIKADKVEVWEYRAEYGDGNDRKS